MLQPHHTAPRAMEHIRALAVAIGGRGSCTPQERQAAEYTIGQMLRLGVERARLEPFVGTPSTYRPYVLAFSAALLGTLAVWLRGGRPAMAAAALLSTLGAWGMLAETDFRATWLRWFLPRWLSQNVVGRITPAGRARQRVVLSAHLDTHRTPVFYCSRAWIRAFSLLVGAAFASMLLGTAGYAAGAAAGWSGARWIGLVAAAMELLAVVLCLHADTTPFSPGANDDASGVGVILDVARCLQEQPLHHTEVWLALTGCEEAAAYGMAAFLDAHTAELGPDALYIIVDQVGQGRLGYLTADGLILKRRTHPRALGLARAAADALPALSVQERAGVAYTDAAVATKRGLVALTLVAVPLPGTGGSTHWHQMSDVPEHIDPRALADAHTFVWQVLQDIDAHGQK